MWSKIGRVTHILLTLLAVGCCAWLLWRDQHREASPVQSPGPERARSILYSDSALRTFLKLKSIGGSYDLPEGENYGVIALLAFEDGKCRGRRGAWQITGSPEGTRTVSYQVLWGRGADGGTQVAAVIRTPRDSITSSPSKDADDFFNKLDEGPTMQLSGTLSDEVRGYGVLGFMSSSKVRAGKERFWHQYGDVNFTLDTRETVAVIGVKTFPTLDQASEWVLHREPADP